MFFWTRAALCIGTIVFLVEQSAPSRLPHLSTALGDSGSSALVSSVAALCRAHPLRCLGQMGDSLGASTDRGMVPPTVSPSYRRPPPRDNPASPSARPPV